MTIIGAFAGYNLKLASSAKGIRNLLHNKHFYLGGILYFVSSLLNIYILRYLEYSVVLPLTSITYIWTLILSYFFLKENITVKKVIGIIAIIIGAICVVV